MDLQRTLATNHSTPLTLRDVFAAAALIGLMPVRDERVWAARDIAVDAFALADAMLAEREKERAK